MCWSVECLLAHVIFASFSVEPDICNRFHAGRDWGFAQFVILTHYGCVCVCACVRVCEREREGYELKFEFVQVLRNKS